MQDKIHFRIITTNGIKFEKMANFVQVPLVNGNTGILANHAPMLAAVEDGPVKCLYEDKTEYICVGSGVVDVNDNEVVLLVRHAELAEDIDFDRASNSKKRARERLEQKPLGIDILRAEESLDRALAREKTYELMKKLSE